jgi:hypothetical protein
MTTISAKNDAVMAAVTDVPAALSTTPTQISVKA